MVFAIIMSSLALLAATANMVFIIRDRKRNQERNTAMMQYADAGRKQLEERIGALEQGAVPDFEKAREAAKAVNDFNSGITGILGFDPYAALQQQREREHGGEAV